MIGDAAPRFRENIWAVLTVNQLDIQDRLDARIDALGGGVADCRAAPAGVITHPPLALSVVA